MSESNIDATRHSLGEKQTATSDARDDRLKIRKSNQEVIRLRYREKIQEECRPFTRAFGECAKDSGLMIIFNCREQKNAMNECMQQAYSDEGFKKFLIESIREQNKNKVES